MAGAHTERIMALLAKEPGLNDDEISKALSITPRQTVNQICRTLQAQGALERRTGAGGKIVNFLSGANLLKTAIGSAMSANVARRSTPETGKSLVPRRLGESLLIIPCSKRKFEGGDAEAPGPHFVDRIAPELAAELISARKRVAEQTVFDETLRLPAWQRYDGSLYRAGADSLRDLRVQGTHVIIISGGYGLILAEEPIGNYDQVLKAPSWPSRLLPRALLSYASLQGIVSVRAFSSATSPYFGTLRGIRWNEAGVQDALLISPEAQPGGTLKSPASIGEAITELAAGNLWSGWRSSYGLGLNVYGA